MKKLLYFSAFLIATSSTLNAQNSRHEIGIGVGPVQFYHRNYQIECPPKCQSNAERSRVSGSLFADQTCGRGFLHPRCINIGIIKNFN